MKRTIKTCLALAAVLSAAGCGSPIFYVDADEPSICKTVQDVPFDPTIPGQDLTLDFPIPVGQYLPVFNPDEATVSLHLTSVTFTAKQGITDFNSVDTGTIQVVPPSGSTQPQTTVLAYTRDPNNPPGTTLTVSGERDVEIMDYLTNDQNRQANLHGVLTGQLPNNYWTADVKVCFHMHARFNYAHKYGL